MRHVPSSAQMPFRENARKLTFPPFIIAPRPFTQKPRFCVSNIELIYAHVVRKTSTNKSDKQFCGARQRGHPVRRQTRPTPPPLRGRKLCSSFALYGSFLRAGTSETLLFVHIFGCPQDDNWRIPKPGCGARHSDTLQLMPLSGAFTLRFCFRQFLPFCRRRCCRGRCRSEFPSLPWKVLHRPNVRDGESGRG